MGYGSNKEPPGLQKRKKRESDTVSKIDKIITYMTNRPEPMKTIKLSEAADVADSTERNIQIQMCDSGLFKYAGEKGVYRLISNQKPKEPKQTMNDGIKDSQKTDTVVNNPIEIPDIVFVNKNKPKKIIEKTTFHCPHCNLEVLKD